MRKGSMDYFHKIRGYNFKITIFAVFLISLTIKALLKLNYEILLKLRRTKSKLETIDTQEMHQLNPKALDDI